MAAVEMELWNIFTYYTLHGNSGNPELMMPLDLYRLCRDCQMTEVAMYRNAIEQQDVHIICASELKKRLDKVGNDVKSGVVSKKGSLTKSLTYAEFLNVLTSLSKKLYSDAPTLNESFQQLLMENILPLAHRRNPQTIENQLRAGQNAMLRTYFDEALLELYKFYAAESQNEEKATTNSTVQAKDFDELGAQSTRSRNIRRSSVMFSFNSAEYASTKSLSYIHWMKFCSDFGLSSSMLLTQVEVGDIYLGCVTTQERTGVRKMKFPQFWEAIVRCALTAYRSVTTATTANKIRAVFVYMWKHIQDHVVNRPNDREADNERAHHKRGLSNAVKKLNNKTLDMWAEVEYRDFLSPDEVEEETAHDIVASLEELPPPKAPEVSVELVEDEEPGQETGDKRIDMDKLRILLERKPEMARFLAEALDKAGISTN
mmetsp:Transcript_17062/g.40004  ORF Transcript_17062/g.40004 Transcript_17062/m.40004 type:complete len:429 (-) Transcript_17062:318-1604(-)|eukprot:CAMPEP_0119482594 /NCGR_PEP_ID=MMETSP1344-20130328/10378_1 /TAXON_ID=236787 /ORGANISM="Florenciella parvula, Strain CCMP2471" /LENGTH=428 /DNA_ID=CAMNT_0007517009 /DNA_START=99 /DNA_END=1385 /DNA_ORIENTATION=+